MYVKYGLMTTPGNRRGVAEERGQTYKDEAVETRNQILDAAERLFSERGVSRTSLADIAEAAAVTRGAIYWHFKDKAELFCDMVARVTMPMEDAPCQTDHRNSPDPLGSVRAMLVGILRRTSGDAQARRVFHIVFHKCEYVEEMEPVRKRFSEMQAGCQTRLEQGLRAAIERGQLPSGLDARRAAVGLHALLDGLISSWVKDPESMPPANDAGPVIDVFLDGISRAAPRPARKRAAGARKAPHRKPAPPAARRRIA